MTVITIPPDKKLRDEINIRVEIDILQLAETRFYWKLPHERPVMARGPHTSIEEALADARVKCAAVMRKFKS